MTPGSGVTALGFLVGALVLYRAARRRDQATEGMGWIALAGLAGGVLGAKLTEWALHPGLWGSNPAAIIDPRMGGRTLIGGLLAGWLAVVVAKRCLGIRRSTGDLFALALPAGEAVGRLGCFLNACCYGTASTVPWKVFQHGMWRHPSQLYSALAALVILALLLAMRDRLPREGDLFRLYLLLFGISRFGLEFVRERSTGLLGLSLAQWVCAALVVYCAASLLASRRGTPAAAV